MLTSPGHVNDHNISIRGRNKSTGYYFSVGITDQEGFLENDEYGKYNFRINLDNTINDWLNIGLESFATNSDYSGVATSVGRIFCHATMGTDL